MEVVIDLFAGAGGLSLGASRAGFQVMGAIEWDKSAATTHARNFPNTILLKEDIMQLNGGLILKKLGISSGCVSGVIGGPPCQGFSNIGKGDVNDCRNNLFIKFFELVSQIRPKFFLAENVPGILNDKYKSIREAAKKHLTEYQLFEPLRIKASDLGAPTTRTRVFFIGIRSDLRLDLSECDFHMLEHNNVESICVKDALSGLPELIVYSKHSTGQIQITKQYYETHLFSSNFFHSRVVGCIPAGVGDSEAIKEYQEKQITTCSFPTLHTDSVKERFSRLKYGEVDTVSRATRLNPNGFCPTLRAGTGPEKGSYQAVRPIHYKYPRVITPREAARLQGFPDWFVFAPDIWHCFRQIGNSVSPLIAEKLLYVIHQKLTSK